MENTTNTLAAQAPPQEQAKQAKQEQQQKLEQHAEHLGQNLEQYIVMSTVIGSDVGDFFMTIKIILNKTLKTTFFTTRK